MPWQQYVADVATEIDPATGQLWYREIRLTVPRQSGKTTLLLPKYVWRAEAAHLLGGRQRMLYAAQSKNDAIDKFDEDYVEDLAASRVMRGRYRVTNVGGRKRIRFRSGSLLMPVATTVKAGHGKTIDDGTLDEAFSQVDNRVEAAWRPAMITRQQAQLWIVSTAGNAASLYLRSKTVSGRAIVEAHDPRSRTAYFEWSAPKDADPYDPATWWSCMPALGFTQTEDAIRHELETMEGGLPEFRRAYLNQWADEFLDAEWGIPRVSWQACGDPASRREGPPAIAVDVTPDRAKACVGYVAARADKLPMGQVVRLGDGVGWLAKETEKLAREKGATCVVVDGGGPAANLAADIEAELKGRCPVVVTTAAEYADACGTLFDSCVTEQFRHTEQHELTDAVKGAVQAPLGDRWKWGRRKSTANISPLVAMSLALHGLTLHPGNDSILY